MLIAPQGLSLAGCAKAVVTITIINKNKTIRMVKNLPNMPTLYSYQHPLKTGYLHNRKIM
jgi:hypothetical protein